ncbi:ABC transporter permease [Nakamurella flavida]|uniref:ABC transporter permease n=1 Tax=Nakamurella flavida TaxID=363630 RepID=A0A939C536_9ACTN|nr:ABC transporter permease [Nakamurella flavida]MBM9476399.1 ABC transporter permease [Nakamurella flavida]MDP9779500.1 peptide/nickel transport system permease protein [Nakamurella flavida]
MLPFLRRRVLSSVVTVLGVLVIVFFLARLTGSPASLYLPEGASQERYDQFNRQYGFDQPLWVQFLTFLKGAVQLDFGESIWQQRPALQAAVAAMGPTLELSAVALGLSIVVAVVLGSIAATHRFRAADRLITLSSLTTASIPDFWFALVGVLIFAVNLRMLPTSGDATASAWILPVLTLMLSPVGVLTQVVRGAMIESLTSGYVQNARARGFAPARLTYRHALRNAALPIISVAGDKAAGMVNGAIIVGTVFAFPGIGTLIVGAVLNRDFAVIQASVFVVGIAVVLLNIVVDLIYAIADPRVRIS